ncbi:dUTP diphosphatase [Bacillus sp. FSL K6-3431]|uniref:dUTP diphosphatase n=1 Tax=Bacillus sp. FSL K6-3431 TaxID=2921500 RepID=UPI004046E9B9
MNLIKLFEMQKVLDDRILEKHPELKNQNNLDWKILALQVELGECANEWRGFKKWSKDQEPRIFEPNPDDLCEKCNGDPTIREGNKIISFCDNCDGVGVHFHNPLLEEYVDCLHFILSIGLELQFGNFTMIGNAPKPKTVTDMFLITFESINNFYKARYSGDETLTEIKYTIVFDCFLTLGEMLGFTWEQIEQAYISKNEINHVRQSEGY